MHDFAERGIASHWIYKSSEKIESTIWRSKNMIGSEILVEIMEKETAH